MGNAEFGVRKEQPLLLLLVVAPYVPVAPLGAEEENVFLTIRSAWLFGRDLLVER